MYKIKKYNAIDVPIYSIDIINHADFVIFTVLKIFLTERKVFCNYNTAFGNSHCCHGGSFRAGVFSRRFFVQEKDGGG